MIYFGNLGVNVLNFLFDDSDYKSIRKTIFAVGWVNIAVFLLLKTKGVSIGDLFYTSKKVDAVTQNVPLITNIELHVLLGVVLAYLLARLWFGRKLAREKALITWENEKIQQLPDFVKSCERLIEFSERFDYDMGVVEAELKGFKEVLGGVNERLNEMEGSFADQIKGFKVNYDGLEWGAQKDIGEKVREFRIFVNGIFEELKMKSNSVFAEKTGGHGVDTVKGLSALLKSIKDMNEYNETSNLVVRLRELDQILLEKRGEFRAQRAVEFDLFEFYFPLVFGLVSLAIGLFEILRIPLNTPCQLLFDTARAFCLSGV